MQLLVIQFTIKMYSITNSCIWNICVTLQDIDYKLIEEEKIVSSESWDNLLNNCAFVGHSTK
jgi:hypothetical protein